jgi:hypothetical protein
MRTILLAAALSAATAAHAATITMHPAFYKDAAMIFIEGDLAFGDEKQFAEIAQGAGHAVVEFNSGGGNTLAGIGIGETIHRLGDHTLVTENMMCASACALAWLGGTKRFAEPIAHIGMHAAVGSATPGTPNSAGDAIVGAYLRDLGFTREAIIYLTRAGPNEMQWLDPVTANSLGIAYTVVDHYGDPITGDKSVNVPGSGIPTPGPRPSPPIGRLPDPPPATDWATSGIAWIQVGSRPTLTDAQELAASLNLPNLYVFQSSSPGLLVIVAGPYSRATVQQELDLAFQNWLIPYDSHIVSGRHFSDLVWAKTPMSVTAR